MGQPLIPIHVRWAVKNDLPKLLEIERKSFSCPWSQEDYVRFLKGACNILLAAEYDNEVVGLVGYVLRQECLEIVNFAVHPLYRRLGVGTAMVQKMTGKLSPHRRSRLVADVPDYNLKAHLFFRDCGFRAVRTLRNRFVNEDAYRFVWVHPDTIRVRIAEGATA